MWPTEQFEFEPPGFDIVKLDKSPLIYSVSHLELGALFGEGLSSVVYFGNCITRPSQVQHRPFQCSAVITTPYVRR